MSAPAENADSGKPFKAIHQVKDTLLCDLCLRIFQIREFNKHDCAVNYTRRLEVNGNVVKCPSVILKPLKVDMAKNSKFTKSVIQALTKSATMSLKIWCCRYCDTLFEKNHVKENNKHIKEVHCVKFSNEIEKTEDELLLKFSKIVRINEDGMICPRPNCEVKLCSLFALKKHLKHAHSEEITSSIPEKQSKSLEDASTMKKSEAMNTSMKLQISNVVSLAKDVAKVSNLQKVDKLPAVSANNSATVLLHPPPLSNMKPGIYNFVLAQQECKINKATTFQSSMNTSTVSSDVGVFINVDSPETMYVINGSQVANYTSVADNGKTNFAIGGIPANFKIPNNLNLPLLNKSSGHQSSDELKVSFRVSNDHSVEFYQWECPVCSVKSTSLQVLRNHLKQKHFFLCKKCGGCFVTNEFHKKHTSSCQCNRLSTKVLFFCLKCSQAFISLKIYYDHLIDLHQSDVTFDEHNGQVFPSCGIIQSTNANYELSIVNTVDQVILKVQATTTNTESAAANKANLNANIKRKANCNVEDVTVTKRPNFDKGPEIIDPDKQDNHGFAHITQPQKALVNTENAVVKPAPAVETDKPSIATEEPSSCVDKLLDANVVNLDKSAPNVVEAAPVPNSNDRPVKKINGVQELQLSNPEEVSAVKEIGNNAPSIAEISSISAEDSDVQIEEIKKLISGPTACSSLNMPTEPELTVIDDDIQIISELSTGSSNVSTSLLVKREVHICPTCSRSFYTLKAMKEHMKTHAFDAGATCEQIFAIPSNSDVFICRICCLAYEKYETFNKHMKRHGLFFGCIQCNTLCFDNTIAKGHAEAHASLKLVFGCPICKRAFRRETSLLLHMHNEHNFQVLWMCLKCNRANTDWATMAGHALSDHKSEGVEAACYIVPCPQAKLHYQPEDETRYAAQLNSQPTTSKANQVTAAECPHRTFLSYNEALVCCPVCGSMIPATKFLLEHERLRKLGQFKLLLVDENTEKLEQNRHPFYKAAIKQQQQIFGQQQHLLKFAGNAPNLAVQQPALQNKPLPAVPPHQTASVQAPQLTLALPNVRPSVIADSIITACLSSTGASATAVQLPSANENKCSTCHLVLPTFAALKVHNMKHNVENVLFCLECGFSAKSLKNFFGHVFDNHSQKLNGYVSCTCDSCGEQLPSLAAYKQHLHVGLQRCDVCLLPVSTDDHAAHVQRHSEHGKFCCVFCGVYCNSSRELNIHEVKHVCDSWVMCRECGMCYRQVDQLIGHFQAVHLNISTQSNPICEVCKLPVKKALWYHLVSHHMVFAVRMKADLTLEPNFRRKSALNVYQKSFDKTKFKEIYVCQHCCMPLFNVQVARMHSRTLHEKSIFWSLLVPENLLSMTSRNICNCFYCQFTSHFMTVPEHLKTKHTNDGRYFCRQCDDCFDNSFDLNYHEQFNHSKSAVSADTGGSGMDQNQQDLLVNPQQLPRNPSFSPLYCPLCGICVTDISFMCHLNSHKLPFTPTGFVSLDMCALCGICFIGKDSTTIRTHAILHRVSFQGGSNHAAWQSQVFLNFKVGDGPSSVTQPPSCALCDEILTWNGPHVVRHYVTEHTPQQTVDSLQNYHAHHAHLVTQGRLQCRMCNFLAPCDV